MKISNKYSAPEIQEANTAVCEAGFAASADWYNKAGEGDFRYTIDEDNTWA